jgi:hypothetical protein
MRVKVEYGNRVRETDVERTEIVEVNSIKQLYFKLKREYLAPLLEAEGLIEGEPNCSALDYLNEFSEVCDIENTFYIGFEEGAYIEGWQLV